MAVCTPEQIAKIERDIEAAVKAGTPVSQAMPRQLANMLEAAQKVTSHFPSEGLQRAVTDLLNQKGRTPEDMQMMARSMRGLYPEQKAAILSNMRGKQQPWYYWAWQQGLISGEVTHTKYVLTNLGFSTFDRVLSPTVAAVVSRLRGGEKTYFGEPFVALVSMVRGFPAALKGAGAAFKAGTRLPLAEEMQLADRLIGRGERLPKDLLQTQAVPYGNPGAPNWGIWQRVLNDKQLQIPTTAIGVFGRSATAIHSFFKLQNARASMAARAYHAAAKEVSNPLSKEFEERYNYHYLNPSDEDLRGSVNDGYSGTFMDRLPPSYELFASKAHEIPIVKWLFPFMHIPFNIVRQTIRYSPVAPALKSVRDDLVGKNGEQAQNLAIARMMVGTGIMGYFIWQGFSGNATGDYPIDPKERAEWKVNGKIPNAVKFRGEWVQMQRFGPQGNLAAIGADIGNIIARYAGKTDEDFDEKMMNIVGHSALAWLHSIANEAGMLSLQNIMNVFEGQQTMAEWLAYEASTFIPASSFIRQTASLFDPDMRQAKTFWDGLKASIPGARNTLLPKRDPLYGEPIANPGYLTPFREVPVKDADPILQELNRIQYFPSAPESKIGGVKLTPEQFDRYEATAGPLVKKALTDLMSTPYWKMHNNQPEWQKEVAKQYVAQARAQARATMQAESIARDGPNNLVAQGLRQRQIQINGVQ